MSAAAGRVRCEAGFTLVEILVALSISLVVLLATLQSLDAFTSNAAHQSRVTDANEQVRSTMDRTVNRLRGASVIVRATATDLVYAVPEAGGVRNERLCVAAGELYGSTTLTASPAAPATACASGSKIASLKSTSQTAFTYDGASSSATPALVKNVGLTFSLAATSAAKTTSSTLQASAARRPGVLLTTGRDLEVRCEGNEPVLSLSPDVPGVSALNVTFASSTGVSLGSASATASVKISAGFNDIVATVTDALGVANTLYRSVECAS